MNVKHSVSSSLPRTLVAILCSLMLALGSGCATHETLGDPAQPQSELAVVEGYWRFRFLYDEELHIVSVDGKREGDRSGWPYAKSMSVPAGMHWLQIAILRNSRDIAMCAFEWTLEPEHRYKLNRIDHDQALLAHPASATFAATIAMTVTAPTQPDQNVIAPALCGKGRMCRKTEDCADVGTCRIDENGEFGFCESAER